jgi:uncharacterized protein (TIGR03000 family)
MFSRYLLIPAVLSVAGLLATADAAQAQRGGGRGGGHSGGHSGGHYYGGGYYRGGYYGPYVGIGLGYYGSAYPYYPYAYDPYVVPRVAYYPPSTTVIGQQPTPLVPEVEPNVANIRVLVGDPKAKVWFDGTLTSQGGTDRLYHTPALTTGANNTYRIRAMWIQSGKEMVQERVVPVSGGRLSVVDFTQPLSEGVPPPPAK